MTPTKVQLLQSSIERTRTLDGGELAANVLEVAGDALAMDAPLTDLFSTADLLIELRTLKDALKVATEAVNERLGQLNEVQYDLMLEQELQSFNRRGQTLYLKETLHAKSIVGYEDEALNAWLEANGWENLPKAKVNAQSFGAAMRERMKLDDDTYDHEKLPEGWENFVGLTRSPEVGFRKAGK